MGLFREGWGTVVDSFEISDMVSERTGIEREEEGGFQQANC